MTLGHEGSREQQEEERWYIEQKQLEIGQYRQHIDKYCQEADDTQTKSKEIAKLLQDLETNYPEFAQNSLRKSIRYSFLILVFPAVYIINLLLIYRPVEYLAGQAFDQGSWQVVAAIVLLPIAIQLAEIAIGTLIYFSRSKRNRTSTKIWNLLAIAMVLVAPVLVLATFLAKHSEGKWLPHDVLLLLALFTFALVTDAVVVFGAEAAMEAKTFWWVKLKQNRFIGRIRSLNRTYSLKATAAEKVWRNYMQQLDKFNQEYPSSKIEPGSFNAITRRILNEWMGYEVI